jgi:hypothetical protein
MELDFLQELLDEPSEDATELLRQLYAVPPQEGPFKFYDKEMRCLSRRCGSPTYYKLQGVPYCSKHIILKMNEMLIELGVEE